MTVPFSARRRAEEFDALLAGASSPRRPPSPSATPTASPTCSPWSTTCARSPRSSRAPSSPPPCASRLMAEADTVLVQQSARVRADEARLVLPQRPRARDRRLAALLGGAALVGATTSMAVAAQTALPGDSLYPVKRAIEDARTGLASDDAARGARLLASARGRLAEVDQLARTASLSRDAAVADTLVAFDEQATEASEAPARRVRRVRRRAGHPLAAGLHRHQPRPAGRPRGRRPGVRPRRAGRRREHARRDRRPGGERLPGLRRRGRTLPPFLLTASAPGQDVGTVLSTSSDVDHRPRAHRPARHPGDHLRARTSAASSSPSSTPRSPAAPTDDAGGRPPVAATTGGPTGGTAPAAAARPGVPGTGGTEAVGRTRSTTSPSCSPATCPPSSTRCPSWDRSWGPSSAAWRRGVGDTLDQTTDPLLDCTAAAPSRRVSGRRCRAPGAACRASAGSSRAPGR